LAECVEIGRSLRVPFQEESNRAICGRLFIAQTIR